MFSGLLFTLIAGLSFLIGIVILKTTKDKEKMSLFTISLAFIVMLGLICFDLLPEIIEYNNIFLLIPVIVGFILLVFLDKLIPHHHHEHEHCDHLDHEKHLNHIGFITIIAFSIHNMIEGLSLYSVTVNDIKAGLLMMISISLHNIPLGFQIGSNTEDTKTNKLLIFILVISSLIGALIMILFGNLNELLISILLSLTLGMLLYILIFELFNEIRKYFKCKEVIYGIILGIVVLFITYMI